MSTLPSAAASLLRFYLRLSGHSISISLLSLSFSLCLLTLPKLSGRISNPGSSPQWGPHHSGDVTVIIIIVIIVIDWVTRH